MTNSTQASTHAALDAAAGAYVKQSKIVADLRCKSQGSEELTAAEATLRELKRAVDAARKAHELESGSLNDVSDFNREGAEGLLKRRFFIAPSFEIYGGVAGLFDYGPPGCSVKNNLLAMWRQHFVVEEAMLELEASCLTPEPVLKASGHVDKFSDLMVKDVETGSYYRADHLLRDHLNSLIDESVSEEQKAEMTGIRERLDEFSAEDLDEMIAKYGAKAPETGNEVTKAYPFNLMFQTSIGPSGMMPGYLRPETAQGIFVNFKRLMDYMGGKLPFACAQIGLSFRNEISPKAGLLRVREFQQAEIEHFVNPQDKSHAKFDAVKDVEINMYGREQQMKAPFTPVKIKIGDAVSRRLIGNETLGYFIGRTSEFVKMAGMKMEHVRFRQHLEHEMAHYAADCWDLEINCSYGWTECAGLADRSAYDLGNHSEKSGIELTAREVYSEPRNVESLVCVPNKGLLGRAFKKSAQLIMKELAGMEEVSVKELKQNMDRDGKCMVGEFEVMAEHVSFKTVSRKETGRNFYPSVIEPSFGIGRLLYCLWEHCYYVREGGDGEDGSAIRAVLGLKAKIAPVKCAILPLSKNSAFEKMLEEIGLLCGKAGLINRVDDSGVSIGKRYSRADEIGTPFGITVDFRSVEDGTVTIRERDSTEQVRCSVEEAVRVIRAMVDGELEWNQVRDQYGLEQTKKE
eukprot:GFKZ01003286.1.p1 GENE.GFKZ01003286.1~~GFKZ01003286.1.p1  ORF type:complete len:687 (-),score=120.26 GFKZ01003286.1:257-2317(-)